VTRLTTTKNSTTDKADLLNIIDDLCHLLSLCKNVTNVNSTTDEQQKWHTFISVNNLHICQSSYIFSARCNIYISRLCYDVSIRLSVTEVQWRIIANIGFKFRSHLPRIVVAVHAGISTELFIVQWARGKGSSPGRVEGSSRAMLATARPSCNYITSTIHFPLAQFYTWLEFCNHWFV